MLRGGPPTHVYAAGHVPVACGEFGNLTNRVKYPHFSTCMRGLPWSLISFYQLGLIALVWLCLMLQWAWPSDLAAVCPTA